MNICIMGFNKLYSICAKMLLLVTVFRIYVQGTVCVKGAGKVHLIFISADGGCLALLLSLITLARWQLLRLDQGS